MYKILRIICCVICAAILAACVFLFVYLGTFWGLISLLCAAIFFVLTLVFKGLQEDYDKKHPYNEPVEPTAPAVTVEHEKSDQNTDDKPE